MTKNLLPTLRADLELTLAPTAEGGRPVWMLHDPLNANFTQIDWAQFEIIKRLDRPQSIDELVTRLHTETTIRDSTEEIKVFIGELIRSDLTNATLHKTTDSLTNEKSKRKQGFLKWLIFHYLYFRVPVLHPDKFLEQTLGIFKIITSKVFFTFYIIVGLLGIFFLSQHFDEYLHTFTDFLNPKGALSYAITIAILKLAHEFCHAYTAKCYGNRVPTIGLAFIVMWPIPYCDVTDSWRMDSRSKRLRISAAGIITELIIAGFALFVWGISTNPQLKSITFVLSSISLLSTLLVNLNPLMRFDGYYIFSDLTGIDNLQSRAFSMTKWFYRYKLLGITTDCPEPELSFKRKTFMIIYSINTWIYRFFLYTGIAIIVYYTFPKAIGVILFIVEIMMFIIIPLSRELSIDYGLISNSKISLRFAFFIILLAGAVAWLILPFTRYETLNAITATEEIQIIYSPYSGIIHDQKIKRGTKVNKGDTLLRVDSKELTAQIALAKLTEQQLAYELKQLYAQPAKRGLIPQKRETYLQSQAQLRALEQTTKQSTIFADISGTVTDYKETLQDGVAVFQREELGRIYNLQKIQIRGYATGREAEELSINQELTFIPSHANYSDPEYRVRITHIRPTREEYLPHPELSNSQGGSINTTLDSRGRLKIIDTYFEIECEFIDTAEELRFDQPGILKFWSKPRSYAKEIAIHFYQMLIRESGA